MDSRWCHVFCGFMMFYDSFSWFVLSKLFIVAAEVSCFYPVPPVEQDHRKASRLAGTRCTWCMLPRFPSSWIRVAPRMRSSRRYKTPLGAAEKPCVQVVQATSWRPIFAVKSSKIWKHVVKCRWWNSWNSWSCSSCPPSTVWIRWSPKDSWGALPESQQWTGLGVYSYGIFPFKIAIYCHIYSSHILRRTFPSCLDSPATQHHWTPWGSFQQRVASLGVSILKIVYVRVFTNMVTTNWIMEAVFDAADDTLKVKKESGPPRVRREIWGVAFVRLGSSMSSTLDNRCSFWSYVEASNFGGW